MNTGRNFGQDCASHPATWFGHAVTTGRSCRRTTARVWRSAQTPSRGVQVWKRPFATRRAITPASLGSLWVGELSARLRNDGARGGQIRNVDQRITREPAVTTTRWQRVPGLGPVFAAGLLAEIQTFPSDDQLAQFAGLTWRDSLDH